MTLTDAIENVVNYMVLNKEVKNIGYSLSKLMSEDKEDMYKNYSTGSSMRSLEYEVTIEVQEFLSKKFVIEARYKEERKRITVDEEHELFQFMNIYNK